MKRTMLSLFLAAFAICSLQLANAEDASIIVKNIEGYGENRQKALADAFQNAVRRAVGTYTLSSSYDDGDTLDEKIFLNADAVVKNHKVVGSEATPDGFMIVIDAEIVRNEMMKYIQKTASTEVGEGELANLLAKRNAVNNAVKSLDLIFMNWRENIYRAEKYGDLSIAADDDASGDIVKISIPFILTFNWQAYEVFLAKMRNVLSRIAIDKTSGMWNWKSYDARGELKKKINPFYIKVGLGKASRDGDVHIENPNNYGGVMLFSRDDSGLVKYEMFIVPQQIKNALFSQLCPEAELRFSLTSKSGATVASRSIKGEVLSFGGDYFFLQLLADNLLGWSPGSSREIVIMSDRIKIEFGQKEWVEKRLLRATVPVPLEAAAKIAGCTISVQPMSEEGRHGDDDGDITSQTIDDAEWIRVDGKPRQEVASHSPQGAAKPKESTQRGANRAPTPQPKPKPAANDTTPPVLRTPIAISEKDKTLKSRIDELWNSLPDTTSASKWFKLSSEVESRELRQEMLKATGAALVYSKRSDAYQTRVRSLIKDVSAFEETFVATCPTCNGTKVTTIKCATCSGDGACHAPGCRNGGHLVRQIQGTHWEQCRQCKGRGRCQKCGGTGKIQSNCRHCQGKGKAMNLDSVATAYRDSVDRIEEAFR